MSNMLLKILPAIVLKTKKILTANFNLYTTFSFWQLYSITSVSHRKTFLGVNDQT